MQQWLERFCYKHPKLSIPGLMKYIVIGNVLIYLLDMFSMGGGALGSSLFSFDRGAILSGQVWRLVTFIFVPASGSNIIFFALMLYFYYFIGTALEREWGSNKFTIYYGFGVVLNIIAGFLVGGTTMYYVNMSMFFAFATLYPDMQFIFIIFPVKAKWMAWLDAAYFVMAVLSAVTGGYPQLAFIPVAAVINYLLFFASDIGNMFSTAKRQAQWRSATRSGSRRAGGPKVVNFHDAKTKTRSNAKSSDGALHRCAVCGKTDVSDPNMEFRYCSRCNGYYCYCADHINSHVHIQ